MSLVVSQVAVEEAGRYVGRSDWVVGEGGEGENPVAAHAVVSEAVEYGLGGRG